MAITRVKKAWEQRGGEIVMAGATLTNVFYVETDSHTTDETEVLVAIDPSDHETRIPRIGSQHPNEPYARVQRVRCAPKDKDPRNWVVTVTYSTLAGAEGVEHEADPVLRRPRWGWRTNSDFEEYAIDAVGDAVLNSAGEPFDPSPQRRVVSQSLWIIWNVALAEYTPGIAKKFINTVNDDDFRVVGENVASGEAFLADYSAEYATEGGIEFFSVTAEVLVRRWRDINLQDGSGTQVFSGWDQFPLSMGYTVMATNDSGQPERAQIQIRSRELVEDVETGEVTERWADPMPPQTPMKLDRHGKLITGTEPPFVKWLAPYERQEFRNIGMPREQG